MLCIILRNRITSLLYIRLEVVRLDLPWLRHT
jgi:hypothetical protein